MRVANKFGSVLERLGAYLLRAVFLLCMIGAGVITILCIGALVVLTRGET